MGALAALIAAPSVARLVAGPPPPDIQWSEAPEWLDVTGEGTTVILPAADSVPVGTTVTVTNGAHTSRFMRTVVKNPDPDMIHWTESPAGPWNSVG